MSKNNTYIKCGECGKTFHSLGFARHCAMHRDNREKRKRINDSNKQKNKR